MDDLIGMRPINVVLMVVLTLGLSILLGWAHDKRRATKIYARVGTVLTLLVVSWFAPFNVGPASWADAADWSYPDGYAQHSVETSISAQQDWIVGETKECYSSALDFRAAEQLDKEPGYVAALINCDDGPKRTVTVNLYGHLNQPEHAIIHWRCTRDSGGFTCHQTGAE